MSEIAKAIRRSPEYTTDVVLFNAEQRDALADYIEALDESYRDAHRDAANPECPERLAAAEAALREALGIDNGGDGE